MCRTHNGIFYIDSLSTIISGESLFPTNEDFGRSRRKHLTLIDQTKKAVLSLDNTAKSGASNYCNNQDHVVNSLLTVRAISLRVYGFLT